MKKIIIPILFFSAFSACTSNNVNQEADSKLGNSTSQISFDDRFVGEVLYDPTVADINFNSLSSTEKLRLAEQDHEKMVRLSALAPFPIKQQNNESVSWQKANEDYKSAVNKLVGNPILPLFQQRYASIMLKEYGPQMSDVNVKQYYIDQLLDGQSIDFPTLTDAIASIKDNSDELWLHNARNRAVTAMQKRIAFEKQVISGLKQPANARQKASIWNRGRLIMLKKLEESPTSKQLDRIKALAVK